MRKTSKTIIFLFSGIFAVLVIWEMSPFGGKLIKADVEVASEAAEDFVEVTNDDYVEETVTVEDGTHVVETTVVTTYVGYWTSEHTELDKGKIIIMDHANKGKKDADAKDNYITILTESGEKKIYRDVDIDLYLNLKVGDIIQ